MKSAEKIIVRWLKEKIKQANAKGLIFGLSGGLDSAVVAALSKKAVGKRHLAVMMPCYSSGSSTSDAKKVVKKLELNAKKIDLSTLYDCAIKMYPKGNKLACANLKARLRMITLYFLANIMNYLVVGTGNKSELLMGYYTKYGDGGVDILPIADLLKSDVRILAKQLGLPKEIIKKAPSADLWAGQTDENEMGIAYEELDEILFCISRRKKCSLAKNKINKVKKMKEISKHKREMPEICKVQV